MFLKFLLIFPLFSQVLTETVVDIQGNGQSGAGQTYDLIRTALGPNSVEVPDCGHNQEHIGQETDQGTNNPYFIFFLHADPDDDQCSSDLKQRTEISVSPEGGPKQALTTEAGQAKNYMWSFRVPAGFMSPNNQLTDIFQLQAKTNEGRISVLRIVLTSPTAGTVRLQVMTFGGENLDCSVDFTKYLEQWVEVDMDVTMRSGGSSSDLGLNINPRGQSGSGAVLSCQREVKGLDWKDEYEYARPKWGIKRRKFQGRTDVQVHFDNFRIDVPDSKL